jgi:hypothetical protein
MSVEFPLLLAAPQNPVDGLLWTEFSTMAVHPEVYNRLLPEADVVAAEKQVFYDSGLQHVPNLRPRTVAEGTLDIEEWELLSLKQRFLPSKSPSVS